MLKNKIKSILLFSLLSIFVLSACSNTNVEESKKETVTETKEDSTNDTTSETVKETEAEVAKDVEITDNKGKYNVPVNPEIVVVLDSRAFETLSDWGVKLAAAPKDVMHADSPIVKDESVLNIGNHREPKFETLASVNPQIVIVGQRFSQHYDAIKEVVPNAIVLDINIDLNVENPGQALVDGFKRNTEILGKIFNKNSEAQDLIKKLDEAVNSAKSVDKKDSTFMGLIVSGGEIGYSAPNKGRVWGPVFSLLELKHSLEIENSTSDHQGDDISVESIANSNPDVLLVLDRDAAVASADSKPAKDVIEGSQAMAGTNAVKNGKIFYAPSDTYTNESIQTYTELFQKLAEFLAN